ncbi:TetR/AcrR family transcriptional regulator C-terminal domain-containing protein [Nocardia sp. NPDC059764]|uniref:TetR/AcrR family transcriptional regulator C-terminal domain-containing protein n=1 Tax=Nocardia sp. NPDC059764 TaxID=3346939 RepID=UPI003664C766
MTRSVESKARDPRTIAALLWDEPLRGPKTGLTVQGITAAAVARADVDGLEAVSMNKVAATFGASGMALYRHIPGKTALVELMVEAVLAVEPALPETDEDWRTRLLAWARQLLEIYRAHPWLLAATAMRRQLFGPNQLRWMDTALAVIESTGLGPAERHQVLLLIAGHVRNLAQQHVDFDADHAHEWQQLTGELVTRHAERFPALARTLAETTAEIDPLEFGLDRIFDGVQTLVAESETTA